MLLLLVDSRAEYYGFGIFKKNELERLFRDAHLGRIHLTNASLSQELVDKLALGINLDSTPRWG